MLSFNNITCRSEETIRAMRPIQSGQKAFSLVEVAMALGVTAFAIVPIIGLLSIGLSTARANIDNPIEAQIVGWVEGNIRASGTSAPSSSAWFDAFGISLPSQQNALFQAQTSAITIALPGASATSSPIKAWNVVVTSPARANGQIGTCVVWNVQ
jgi:uncharacterized protein (TIGR02598 family)